MTLHDFLIIKDYWYAFVSAVLGCIGGIQWTNWRAARNQRKADRESRRALLVAIQNTVQLANQASTQFQTGQPNFPLETERPSFLCNRVSRFRDPALRGEIEGLIYQCSHYNAKLSVVNSAYMTSLVTNSAQAVPLLTAYSAMMVDHLKKINGWATPIIEKLQAEEAR